MTVIINKLHKKEQLCLYCLIFWNICSQIILNNLIQSFTLIVHLRMISDREMLLNHLNLADFLSKIWSNVRISICHDTSWKVKMTFNMLKKKLHEICNYNIVLNKYKQYIFYNMTNYNQNAVIFLTIFCFYWWKQSHDSI